MHNNHAKDLHLLFNKQERLYRSPANQPDSIMQYRVKRNKQNAVFCFTLWFLFSVKNSFDKIEGKQLEDGSKLWLLSQVRDQLLLEGCRSSRRRFSMEARAGPAAGSSSDTIYPPSDLAREQ